jgi:GNAT superfamily N-acetyltransferase
MGLQWPPPCQHTSAGYAECSVSDRMKIEYRINPTISNDALNCLFADAWPGHAARDFSVALARSLGYICAFAGDRLAGLVDVAWDGDKHAFLLDPTVHTEFQRQGIGSEPVRHAVEFAKSKGVEWLHVDYEPGLAEFYATCGFATTEAGVINLKE